VPRADEHRQDDGTSERGAAGVTAGALSALLQELAHAPVVDPGDAAPAPPAPGEVIGRFELVREVGRGGFGVVFEARDRELGRAVAFKLVRPGRLSGADQLAREAEVIARLSHPNLVTLFDVGRSDRGPYLVLELLRGETLATRLASGPAPLAEAVRIAREVARGLAHAHAQGVVHRDLKPSNVFLCEGGGVKLLDFGLAHAFGRRRSEGGTPAYMAPEQWRGAPEDERTDVYALGVMLFRALSGELPFPDAKRGARGASAAPALETPGAPALGALVGRMLDPDPTRRPRDADEVLTALGEIAAALEPGAPARPARALRRRPRRALLAAAALALATLAAAGAAALRHHPAVTSPRGAAAAPARAIAVLPFSNLGLADEDAYFSDGLAEEILDLLTRLRELKVAASSSSFAFRSGKVALAEIAERLRVDVVLTGSVRRKDDRLRVAAELIDGRSGFRVWSQVYERRLQDVFAIQDDIARQVAAALQVELSPSSRGALERARAPGLDAYDLYLRGRAALRLPASARHLDDARALFERAIAADPEFGRAHAGLCEAWLARYELARAPESFERAEDACRRALDRDPRDGDVLVALGLLHLASGRHEEAERELRLAESVAANPADAVIGLARTHAAQRRLAEAERDFARAKALDPGSWRPYQQLGIYLFDRGRYPDAAREYREVIARTPDNASAHNNLGAAYFMAGDFERAAAAWRASLALAPTTGAYSNVGSSSFYLGRFDDAAAMYAKAVALAPDDHRLWGNLGDARAHLPGRESDAAQAYRKAAALAEERLRVDPSDAETRSDLAAFEASLGRRERARQLAAEALRRDPENVSVHYNAALVEARLGAPEAALDALERAVRLGYGRQLLAADAGLASLRRHPRFAALLRAPNE
jgi:eukaryotic-like serine/threonine-protein kinase